MLPEGGVAETVAIRWENCSGVVHEGELGICELRKLHVSKRKELTYILSYMSFLVVAIIRWSNGGNGIN